MVKYLKRSIEIGDRLAMRMAAVNAKRPPFRAEPRCDFCGSDHPRWLYAASRMSTGEFRNAWRWAACEDCSALLDYNETELMRERMVDFLDSMITMDTDILRLAAELALEEFRRYAVQVDENAN